ncbi:MULTISPECIES: hypothetical protein [Haloferax]|uniref:GIY-YIG domain-containing protein n=1 Tax=Haloferax marinum TaxID=2666143 RepID=A0A6A8G844_9EURY|nr:MULTISPECIES: hypothetical protein [Haloferax]KAB1198118.1 hypothetical protein Hfx1150_11535 [Haloferax sp. CBA1150]MRW97191.1 hypothetical protein [Haloferax marinum]
MVRYLRDDPNSVYAIDDVKNPGTVGTPFDSGTSTSYEEFISEVPGFQGAADAYVYAIELLRNSDDSIWYYVGQSHADNGENGLKNRIRSHTSGFNEARTIVRHDDEILLGRTKTSAYRPPSDSDSHRVIGVERVESLFLENIEVEAPNEYWEENMDYPSSHFTCVVDEMERRVAFEVAIENNTTNVLGGK